MVKTKHKGSKAERELIHLFWKNGWAALRSAGSGSTKYPSPDLIASNNLRKLAIESKAVKDNSIYINKKQIEELKDFSTLFGCEPYIAARFDNRGWYFFSLDDLKETKSSFCINFNNQKEIGFSFEQLVGNW